MSTVIERSSLASVNSSGPTLSLCPLEMNSLPGLALLSQKAPSWTPARCHICNRHFLSVA